MVDGKMRGNFRNCSIKKNNKIPQENLRDLIIYKSGPTNSKAPISQLPGPPPPVAAR